MQFICRGGTDCLKVDSLAHRGHRGLFYMKKLLLFERYTTGVLKKKRSPVKGFVSILTFLYPWCSYLVDDHIKRKGKIILYQFV